jgi:CHAT domain-containing protein
VHGTDAMVPPEATVARVLKEMEGAALVHLAAHGRLVADNPLFSDVLLADGPLLAYDVERLDRAPHTVVLAACDSARSVVCAGDELLGLGAVFLGGGTAQLIAPMLAVPDAETEEIMLTFHRLLAAGHGAADALVRTRAQVGEDVGAAAAASFVCLGAGF